MQTQRLLYTIIAMMIAQFINAQDVMRGFVIDKDTHDPIIGATIFWCWIVVFPVLATVLGAPSYFWAASKWQQFGVGTLFALTLAIILFVMSEIDFTQVLLMIAVGVVSDVVRQAIGNTHKRSILQAYPILPLCIIVWLMKLWTASEWYYQGAAEEISIDYAEGLKTLSSSWALALVIILTLAAGYSAIRIVSWLKKA